MLTNDGAETHELLIVKLAQGVTLDEAMQAEGGGGTVEESWTTNLAAPGGDDEVITLDVEPGNYGLVCFILERRRHPPRTARDATRTDRPLNRRHDMKRMAISR